MPSHGCRTSVYKIQGMANDLILVLDIGCGQDNNKLSSIS